MHMAATDELSSPKEISKDFRIKPGALKDAIKKGRVPHVKIGRSTYISRESFRRWLQMESETRQAVSKKEMA